MSDRIRRAWDALLRRDQRPGRRAERFAATYLTQRGYRILERNYTIGKDEADLIARAPDARTIVIVEIKSRSNPEAAPELRINRAKVFHLSRLAAALQKQPRFARAPMRFDVVAVTWPPGDRPSAKHYENAFESLY